MTILRISWDDTYRPYLHEWLFHMELRPIPRLFQEVEWIVGLPQQGILCTCIHCLSGAIS